MADSFGLKIGLEGEKEFKKALGEINQSFKVLGSEMKLVESQFTKNDTSADALAARHKVLSEQVEAQKKKVEMLKQALANAAETFGENDRRTQAWQIQLNNAQAALNGMERELADNEAAMDSMGKEMDETGDSADEMADDLDDAGDAAEDSEGKFSKLGSVLKGVGVAMGAVVTAAAAAAVSLGKAVVEAYGEYEQLVGGIDTLFKDSSAAMQEYANNAYKTAGMSANDYMSTVTSFSASLISSLGGDTEAAVKYADMAITDMADNANKMGTDIGLIQNAYQGFAKQNYTMLDNLKLGYGGTKTEMERLLADAQAISGIEYDISSYADVVAAIHVIQESMGVAGATAAEAEHTIEGSMNAMKAAVSNLVVGFGNADADIEQLCNNVVDAFQDVLTNITPVIENIISALPTALNALLEMVVELLPSLLETVVDLFSQVLNTLLTLLPQLIPVVIEAVLTIVNTLIENLPLLVEAAIQIVMSLVQGIASALPTLIPAAIQAVITIVQSLINSLPMILDAALQLITGLADGLLAAIPVLIAALPEIILSIINFILDAIPQIIETGIQLLTSLVAALPTIITAIVEAIPQIIDGIITAVLGAIPQIIQAGIDLLISLVQALPQIITTIVAAIPDIISGIVNAVIKNIPLIIQAGIDLLTSLIKNLPTIIAEIVKAVPQIITGLVNALSKGVSQLADVGVNLVKGLWSGIQSLAGWLWDKPWIRNSVVLVLKNYAYTGNLVLQRTYNENYITKRKMQNDGQLPQYHATDTHEAIIDLDTFLAVQMEMERRAKAYTKTGTAKSYPFSKKLICGICGQPHRRKVSHGIAKWVCPTFSNWGKDTCPAKAVPEYILLPLAIELTGSEESIQDGIDHIEVHPGNRLVFHLADGRTAERIWKDRSRADSWTPEMKEAARQKDLERRMANGIGNRHSGNKA